MMDWACPWCGKTAPEEYHVVSRFDIWLEGHVQECDQWLEENGYQ